MRQLTKHVGLVTNEMNMIVRPKTPCSNTNCSLPWQSRRASHLTSLPPRYRDIE
jgi:hypothetical protein